MKKAAIYTNGFTVDVDKTLDAIALSPEWWLTMLVERGVLENHELHFDRPVMNHDYYRVVQPHVHEWYVEYGHPYHTCDSVQLGCTGCPAVEMVPNRLPIVDPE